MPPDGEAYKLVMNQINMQEKALVEFFSGSKQTEYISKTISLIPEHDNIDRDVLMRFSEKLGLINADDLAGKPIYVSLINKNPLPEVELTDMRMTVEEIGDKIILKDFYNAAPDSVIALPA